MTESIRQVAANQQREHIPAEFLVNFDNLTNEELAWLSKDEFTAASVRTYAGWELEYREAFRIECYLRKEDGEFVRGKV